MSNSVLSEFEFMIDDDVPDFEKESAELIAKARQIQRVRTLNGIDTRKISEHLRFNATANIPWQHVTLNVTPSLFGDINNDRITDFVVFDFVEEIETNLNNTLGIINNSFRNRIEHLTITKNVKIINSYSFAFYKNLKAVEFEENSQLWCIGQSVFEHCVKLKTLDLSNCSELEFIPGNLVRDSAVMNLSLSTGVKRIVQGAFDDSSVKYIKIGKDKYKINDFLQQLEFNNYEAFWDNPLSNYEF